MIASQLLLALQRTIIATDEVKVAVIDGRWEVAESYAERSESHIREAQQILSQSVVIGPSKKALWLSEHLAALGRGADWIEDRVGRGDGRESVRISEFILREARVACDLLIARDVETYPLTAGAVS